MNSRTESMVTSQDMTQDTLLKQQARTAYQRLIDQGYNEEDAMRAIKNQMQRVSIARTARAETKNKSSDRDSDDEEADEEDEEDESEDDDDEDDPDAAMRSRFPGPFKGPQDWRGRDLENGCEVVSLSSSDIDSIRSAVAGE